MKVAEKLRKWTEKMKVEWEGDVIDFTASFGVATCTLGIKASTEDLLSAADERLYSSKALGRNRCTGEH
jgi:diguanylate cyclase (GGDEF)-like protein